MAYDEGIAERLREFFEGQSDIVEKKMPGTDATCQPTSSNGHLWPEPGG